MATGEFNPGFWGNYDRGIKTAEKRHPDWSLGSYSDLIMHCKEDLTFSSLNKPWWVIIQMKVIEQHMVLFAMPCKVLLTFALWTEP